MTDTFFDWPDKSAQECGAVRLILEATGFEVTEFSSRKSKDDPPDCEGKTERRVVSDRDDPADSLRSA